MVLPEDDSIKSLGAIFPVKLHRLLCDSSASSAATRKKKEKNSNPPSYEDVISWLPDGKSFKVHNKKQFAQEIMPLYFGSSKYRSFQRNLNMWGFITVRSGPSRGACSHRLFVREYPHYCHQIIRQRVFNNKSIVGAVAGDTGANSKKNRKNEKDDTMEQQEEKQEKKTLKNSSHSSKNATVKKKAVTVATAKDGNTAQTSCHPAGHHNRLKFPDTESTSITSHRQESNMIAAARQDKRYGVPHTTIPDLYLQHHRQMQDLVEEQDVSGATTTTKHNDSVLSAVLQGSAGLLLPTRNFQPHGNGSEKFVGGLVKKDPTTTTTKATKEAAPTETQSRFPITSMIRNKRAPLLAEDDEARRLNDNALGQDRTSGSTVTGIIATSRLPAASHLVVETPADHHHQLYATRSTGLDIDRMALFDEVLSSRGHTTSHAGQNSVLSLLLNRQQHYHQGAFAATTADAALLGELLDSMVAGRSTLPADQLGSSIGRPTNLGNNTTSGLLDHTDLLLHLSPTFGLTRRATGLLTGAKRGVELQTSTTNTTTGIQRWIHQQPPRPTRMAALEDAIADIQSALHLSSNYL